MEDSHQQSGLLSPTLLSPTDYAFRNSFSNLLRKSRSSADVPKSTTSGHTTPTTTMFSSQSSVENLPCPSDVVDNKAKQSTTGFSLRSILKKKSFSTVSDDLQKQGFPTLPVSKTPKAEKLTDGFDELVLSDKTVKLTLTSDRMRKIENNFCFNGLDLPKKPKLPTKRLIPKPDLVIDTGKKPVVPLEASTSSTSTSTTTTTTTTTTNVATVTSVSAIKPCQLPPPKLESLTSPVIVVNSTVSEYLPSPPLMNGPSWMDETLDSIREADKEVERVLEKCEKSPSIEVARRVCIKVAKVITLRSNSREGRVCLSPRRVDNDFESNNFNVAPILLSKELRTPEFMDDISSDGSSPPITDYFPPQVAA